MKLALRVTPDGTRTSAVMYSFRGQDRRYTLGPVKLKDTDKGIGIKQARIQSAAILGRVAMGEGPS